MSPRHLVAFALWALVGCANVRYLGSVGRDGVYSNRGYGLALRVAGEGLEERWRPLDPLNPDDAPALWRPKIVDRPLDLDGDDYFHVSEQTRFAEPTLRILSRTSSVVRVDLTVQIFGKKHAMSPLDAFIALDLKRLAGTSSAAVDKSIAKMQRKTLRGGFEARIAEIATTIEGRPQVVRMALVDQAELVVEEKFKRRQLVRLWMYAPQMTDLLRQDHNRLVERLLLAAKGGPESVQEVW